ncbi:MULTISPECIES: carbohydrate-binding domain-containing protein [unclassified Fibrobacter]|uniref:carbohydrate-binding domain-containing protein n=1 Tax=unclassified Fibrobacter TaxID=2634177 RepID=UPI000D6C29C4|nr:MULTISPECIES: carbohydrate-binding domain-containing protein [unclassified Fibrobacter]PWJ68325.1 uncharacterized protein DUF4353 [Fibrobacter sp. UWR4]PZW68141.1 uncharacterized protein DUF4353 [Fibrobacter sp. UWR1]
MKSISLKMMAAGSLLALTACGDDSTSNPMVNNASGDNLSSGEVQGNIDPCNGLTSLIGDDGVVYCFDDALPPSGDEQVPTQNTCIDADGNVVSQNTIISGIDGSTYMYNAACQKITLSVPPSSSSMVQPEDVSSSSSEVIHEAVSSSSFESVSNGNAPVITYAASGATIANDNGCVTVNGGEVVITCAGEYDFSGSYSGDDAQIRVYSPKADSGVYLNLRGLTLKNTADAPIYVQMASKAFVVAKSETVNTLSDGNTRTKTHTYVNSNGVTKTDTTNAAIYSKDDMTFKGTGTLNVTGNYNNGIQSSNDLRFRGETTINVTAKNNGIKGKGLVDVEKGNITIIATSGDGIKSDECTVNGSDTTITEGKGIVSIKGGSINITKAGDDGIQAFNYVMISDSVSVPSIKVNSTGKGIVSENRVYINGGENTVTSGDDGVHSNLNIDFNGGFTTITAKGNDGVHADSTLRITNGTVYVKDSYEGLEAWYITISGGVTDVYSSDDGWNAAGGNDGSGNNTQTGGNNWGNRPGGFGGGMGGMGSSSGHLTVTGGVHYIKTGSGDTDGIDSNGDLTISGGVVVVECQISGGMGGSFDSDGTASLTTKTLLGFSKSRSEAGTSYNVSFNTNSYYGNSNIAFKPTTSGSYIQGTSQVSTVSNVNSYSKNVTFPNGSTVYYN